MCDSTDNYFQEEPPNLQGSIHGWILWHSLVSIAMRSFHAQNSCEGPLLLTTLFAVSCRQLSFWSAQFCTAVGGENTLDSLCYRWLLPGSTFSTTQEARNKWGCTMSWCKEYVLVTKILRMGCLLRNGLPGLKSVSLLRWSWVTFYTFYVSTVSCFLDFLLVRLSWTSNAKSSE